MIAMLHHSFIQTITKHRLQHDLWRGHFGLEKENIRVDSNGKLALTPHPKAFGNKMDNPYIKTDFSESQIELITPVFESISEAAQFMEALHDIVTIELKDEYLWPSSNPPALPNDDEIPIAMTNDANEDTYRQQLADKYGRKRQLISGVHYNFSFNEAFLMKLYEALQTGESFQQFKDQLYLKVARNTLKYRWLLIYLTAASPVFDKTYMARCVELSDHFDEASHFFPNMNSLRNSECGYRNEKPLYVSYESVEHYVRDLQALVDAKELLHAREYYSPVRIKPASKGKEHGEALLQDGIAYLELRMIDLNPLYKTGISTDSLQFVHLFLVFMLLLEDGTFYEQQQNFSTHNHDSLIQNGLSGKLFGANEEQSLQDKAIAIMHEMKQMLQLLGQDDETFTRILQEAQQQIEQPELSFAAIVKSEIQRSSFLDFHLTKAKLYAKESLDSGYKFNSYEDLELSTQLLLKAAVKRGISFEILDRSENFIVLKKGDREEYVQQATKTSLDPYSTVLLMENKVVTKKVLTKHGIRVPDGKVYQQIEEALADYETYRQQPIVIKPKSTNFGLGITIFAKGFSAEDYEKAVKMAFEYDQTVLLEEFISGKEYRFLVMGDEVVGILHRVPANVVGDGIHSIEQLVHEKNKDPLRGKGYKTPLERIVLGEVEKMFLKQQRKTITDIPAEGEIVYLRENSNISTGGDSIDFTDDIPESYKHIAIQSAKAAGATFCGVDMMIDDFKQDASDTNYSIIEINFNPAIHIHCYPYKGQNRHADEKILDLLFGTCE